MLLPIDADRLGVIASGHVEPVMPWVEKDGRRQPGTEQETDDAGVPLWTVHALVMSDARPTAIAVRVPSRECPQPPALAPAAFERLEVNARVNKSTGQLGTYWSAAGIGHPARHNQGKQDNAA
ncbi:hypothetical protein [Actinomycetospora soli]|uniref:hypothetical protein n=1 Tax=Actinomycetospora soli TaxID=2893887 RepID=UPI001E613623|nr:hypothetical protein [Actinomycetospora soli]MCD2191684.1 hypothetical protein [Actinomycetospora soli]